MSIVQVWIAQDRALVAVDTAGYWNSGERVEGAKFAILPLANSVMACRESQLAFFQVFAQVWLGPDNSSYDKLAREMPNFIEWASAQWNPTMPDAAAVCELHLVGWSDSQQRMAGVSFEFNLKSKAIKALGEIRRCRIGPPSTAETPEQFDDDVAMTLARQQLAWLEANAPDQVTGGRLLVAEIRRGTMETRDLGSI